VPLFVSGFLGFDNHGIHCPEGILAIVPQCGSCGFGAGPGSQRELRKRLEVGATLSGVLFINNFFGI
jgi:hypothetical protein